MVLGYVPFWIKIKLCCLIYRSSDTGLWKDKVSSIHKLKMTFNLPMDKVKARGSLWLEILNRINAEGVLARRGIGGVADAVCPVRLLSEESVEHLLIHCHSHWRIWAKFIEWWGLS